MEDARSETALFCSDDDLRTTAWNRAAEDLTGIPESEALGQFCWEVIRGRGDHGEPVCHPGCSTARMARQGWPVRCQELRVPGPAGEKRVTVSTIIVHERDGTRTILHPMQEAVPAPAPARARPAGPIPELTRRQLQILGMIASGQRAKEIAHQLVLSETTVRNHIRAVLLELGAHSQLEAVAKARQFELVEEALSA